MAKTAKIRTPSTTTAPAEIGRHAERQLDAWREAGLRLNRNETRILHELLTELERRTNGQPDERPTERRIAAVLADEKRNGPQKLALIKSILAAERYPAYTAAKAAFDAAIKNLKLHPDIKIEHTPYFEDNNLIVSFKYDDPADLREIILSLKRLSESDPVRNALAAAEDCC